MPWSWFDPFGGDRRWRLRTRARPRSEALESRPLLAALPRPAALAPPDLYDALPEPEDAPVMAMAAAHEHEHPDHSHPDDPAPPGHPADHPLVAAFAFGRHPDVPEGVTAAGVEPFDPVRGWGWESAVAVHPTRARETVRGVDGTFLVALPAGTYDVTVTVADPRSPLSDITVAVGDAEPVAVGAAGPPVAVTVRVTVASDGGPLAVRLEALGGGRWALYAITICACSEEPPPPPPPPTPALVVTAGGPYAAVAGEPVTLRGTAAGADGSVPPGLVYAWDFGDGSPVVAGADRAEVVHTYAVAGTYVARLAVVADGHAPVEAKVQVVVAARPEEPPPPPPPLPPPPPPPTPPAAPMGLTVTALGPRSVRLAWRDASATEVGFQVRRAVEDHHDHAPHWEVVASLPVDATAYNDSSVAPATAYLYQVRALGVGDLASAWSGTVAVRTPSAPTPPPTSGEPPAALGPIQTHHDTIPDFDAHPTAWTIADGSWSDPATWAAGRIPAAGDIVAILADVLYDAVSDAALAVVGIRPGGALRFRPDGPTCLTVGTLLVRPGGTLQIGTEADPIRPDVTAEVVFSGTLDSASDPTSVGVGLVALGRVTVHGAVRTPFTRLAVELAAGDITLTLEAPVTGWRPGDRLIVPDTRQLAPGERGRYYRSQAEVPALAGFSPDGRAATLSGPLAFDHRGARGVDGGLRILPHVASLSRNVVFRSADPAGTRGHVLATGRARFDVRYAAFHELGRTLNEPTGPSNPIGRYALHMHHLLGPEPGGDAVVVDGQPHQFVLVGNVVDGGETPSWRKWGIDVHGSHFGLVRGNVVRNVAGIGIGTEDGSESHNVFEGNFVAGVAGTDRGAGLPQPGERTGVGYWFRGPNNAVRDNVATGVDDYGYAIYLVHVGKKKVPPSPGADMDRYQSLDMNATALGEFARNESYGATPGGLTAWWVGASGSGPSHPAVGVGPSTIKDFTAWHQSDLGVFGYPSHNLTYDGLVLLFDRARLAAGSGPLGVTFSDYMQHDVTIRDADIQGADTGIYVSTVSDRIIHAGGTGGLQVIEDSTLRNLRNVVVQTLWAAGGPGGVPPRKLIIRNVRFDLGNVPTPGGRRPVAIDMSYRPAGANLIQKDEVFVHAYNQVAGDDFRVFYSQQAADFIILPTTSSGGARTRVGAPEPGLTNAQAWEKYGIAIAGSVAPPEAKGRDGINGLVAPIREGEG